MHNQTKRYLQELQRVMQDIGLWQSMPPTPQALMSQEPFAVDTLAAEEWLQWVFIPRMQALADSGAALPSRIAVSPYVEEALKDMEQVEKLLAVLVNIETLLQNQS